MTGVAGRGVWDGLVGLELKAATHVIRNTEDVGSVKWTVEWLMRLLLRDFYGQEVRVSIMATKKTNTKTPTQKDHRRGVKVGGGMTDVTSVTEWYRAGHFANEDEARGAFKLARQQAVDGMGRTPKEWLGMTDAEYDAWMRDDELPAKRRGKG